jgi:hypothetical protein
MEHSKYGDDFNVGDVYTTAAITVTETHVVNWACLTIASLKRLEKIDADVYLISHGKNGIMDGDPDYIRRYIQVIYHREEKLLEFLASGLKTLVEIINHGIIYGGHRLATEAWDLSMSEKAMMLKHLERLLRNSRIIKEKETYHLV